MIMTMMITSTATIRKNLATYTRHARHGFPSCCSSHLRIDFRQFVGDDGSKVAGLRGPGSPAQILVRMWTKGRSRLAERYCAATAMVKADTSSRAETKGHSHRQIDARDPGRGGRSYTADRHFVLPEGPPLPGEVPAAA